MSTFDAENQVRYSKENRPFVSVSRNGQLLPETKAVIGVIAKHGLVLATGHVSATEGLMLLREGQRQGVQHMVVTHAMNPPILMDLAQMQEAAKIRCRHRVHGQHGRVGGREDAHRPLRAMPSGRWVRSTASCPRTSVSRGIRCQPTATASFLMAMRARGFTEQEIAVMTKDNPAKLLGLR